MKALFKTVSVTLVISVAMLFFSSSVSNKVEAAGAGAVISAAAAVSVIGSMIIGIATYLGDKLPVVNVKDFVNSPDFESSISVSDDGTAVFNPPSPFPSKINETVFNATAREAVKEYNSQLRVYVCGTGGSPEGGGKNRIPGSVFNAAVSAAILGALGSEALADPDNPTGSAAGITLGISTVNGKPQKVTTTYEKSTVEVFDYLGLEYVAFESLLDVKCDFLDTESSIYKKPYFITSDNQLYIFPRDIYTRSNSRYNSYYISESSNSSWCSVSGSTYGSLSDVYRSFRFYENNGIFCMAFYCAGKEVSQLYRSQFIYSSPQLTSYPVLFSDKSQYDKIASNSFNNIEKTLYFYNAQNSSDEITGNDILSVDIISAGYFIGNPTGSTLSTAGKMLSGTENAVQGGTKTTYSDLSDIEKAIYALAKQNGKTYEEMLEQSNLVVENGQIYLEGLDGMTHTIESLLTEFDKLLEQGNINNENTAASVEQLKAILEYLKGLNIEGLGEYIRQLETTLDGLKQGDENREAVLQEISVQLTELKENLDTLGFAEVSADIKNISQILSDAAAKELDVNEIENIDPDWYIEKFPFCLPFDFYRIITLFVRDPVPPVFTVPIKADINAFGLDQSVDEEIVLDLTIFKVNGVDIVQVVLNFVCILGFVLMLIHITTKFFV